MAKKKAGKKKAAKKKATKKKATKRKAAKKKVAKKKKKKATKKKATKKKGQEESRKESGKKKSGKKKKVKRKPNPSFMRPLMPDAALGAVVGSKALPRTQVVKKLWVYIKRRDLQDKQNRRMINADDKLKAIFGGKKQVSMFEMTKLVNRHLQ